MSRAEISGSTREDLEEGDIVLQIYRPNLEYTTLIYKTKVMFIFYPTLRMWSSITDSINCNNYVNFAQSFL